MERVPVQRDENRWNTLRQISDKDNGLRGALAANSLYGYWRQGRERLWDRLTEEFGKASSIS